MTTASIDPLTPPVRSNRRRLTPAGAMRAWFCVALAGQLAFIWMILAHYGRKTALGNFAGWNDKPLITGYVAGDGIGNLMFAAHVLLAAVVTLAGLAQCMPAIRSRAPAAHRWTGQLFFSVAVFLALGGLWLTWVRHTYLSLVSAAAVSLNGALILIFVAVAWRLARRRDFAAHRRWALRAFVAVSGVWFLRIGMMAWVLLTGGLGMNRTMSGPADMLLEFGAYLVPLALLEVYFIAERRGEGAWGRAATLALGLGALVGGLGVAGAVVLMWGPYMV